MFRIAIKGILAHKLRLLTTALAVMLGVAFMAGTFVFTDTITQTFDNLFANVYKTTDAVVRAKAAFTGPQMTGDQRGRIDASLLPAVQAVPGVATAEGGTEGYARIVDKQGHAIGNPAQGAPTIGGSWTSDSRLNVWNLVAGTAPVNDNDVVIDKKSADDAGYRVGDTATVIVQTGPQQFRVSGIVKFGTADSPGGATFALFTLPTAQRIIGEPGKFDSIAVTAAGGVSQTELTTRLAAVLPNGVEAITGAAMTKETQSAVRDIMSVITTFMMVFAGVSLLVAGFMIFNTFAITVAQRTKESALLRALGASKRQVLWSVLLEALAVGLLASLIGLGLGFLVAGLLKALMAAFGMDIPATGVVFNPRTALVVIPVGTLLTVVAAILPARRAGRVPPVAAMREVATSSSGYGSKERVFVGAGLLGIGAALVYTGVETDVSSPLTMLMLGAIIVFFGVVVLSRTLSLVLTRIIAAPMPRLRGEAGVLARQNAMRNPKRTAASAAALLIGVAVVGSITIMASSWKASINKTIDQAFTGDYIVEGGGGMSGGVDPSLTTKLNKLPEVQAATGVRMGFGLIDGSVHEVLGVDAKSAFSLFDVKPLQGSPDAIVEPGTIAIYSDVARDKHLNVGDTVKVLFKDSGEQTLRVGLIYGENQPAGNYVVGMSTYDQNFANRYDMQVYVKRAGGVTPAAGLAAVKAAAKDYAGVKVMDHSGFKAEVAGQINQMLSMVYALLLLAIVIALLGIANTLALAVFERTRELGLLRAVGMTRSQLRQTIRWESVIIALQGALLGTVTGVFFGWALVQAFSEIDVFKIPYGSLAVIIVMAGLAGIIAAIPPSRRAARLNVLKAVVTE